MKLSDAYDFVKEAINKKVPVMLWGAPGIGKSSLIHQIAKEDNKKLIDLRLAQLEPTDLRGIPMPNTKTNRADWFLPAFWPQSNEDGNGIDGPGIVFLDEIEKAPISVKNASLQLVLDRMIGSYKLPDDWAIVCAGNREEDGCFSAPLGSALTNRMIHIEIEENVDAWSAWARENGVCENIIGFLFFRPELLYKQTDDHSFPSPRTWVIASNLISGVSSQKKQKELMNMAVGRAATSEYTVWNEVYKDTKPEAILNGEMPDFDGKNQSYAYAVTVATAFCLRKRKGGIKKIEENVAKFLGLLTPELRVIFFKQQTMNCLEAMANHAAFKKQVEEMSKII